MDIEVVTKIGAIRFSPRYLPLTNAFRATLNAQSGMDLFPVDHAAISWVQEVVAIKARAIHDESQRPVNRNKRHTKRRDHNEFRHYCGDESYDDQMYRDWYDGLVDDDFGVDFAKRYPVGMTSHQECHRALRNMTTETISIGKRIPTFVELEGDYQGETYQEYTGMHCKTVKTRRFHDSHGVHGRKPRYKDRDTHR